MFLARKITRSKWEKEGFAVGEIPADAITVDLRTKGNKLSFWQCGDGTADEVKEAALALATAGNRVDKIEIVWVSDDDLRADEQHWDLTAGRTPVTDLIRRHVDLALLDYVRLGRIAYRIIASIEAGRITRLTKKRVANLIAAAVQEGRVDLADLAEKVRSEVILSIEMLE